jgi:PleD family two-component response regulator
VVLSGSDASRAYQFAEAMRLAVHDLAVPHGRSVHGIVTFSAGVATRVPRRSAARWQDLVGDADVALYAAKARGRDTVQIYSPPLTAISPARVGHATELQTA